jgi:hypothetical protein
MAEEGGDGGNGGEQGRGWLHDEGGTAYPPGPWHLGGALRVSVLLVPRDRLPREVTAATPAGVAPVVARGRAVVGVAFARYAPGGVLAYDELLVAVLGRRGPVPCATIPWIAVDSPASCAGARALWAIPKELARFAVDGAAASGGGDERWTATVGGEPVAALHARPARALPAPPGRWPVVLPTAQRLDGTVAFARNRIAARPRPLRAAWTFAPSGPLGWLAGGRQVLSVALEDAVLVFGAKVTRPPEG